MSPIARHHVARVLALAAALCAYAPARAQMVPIGEERTLDAHTILEGVGRIDQTSVPAIPFGWYQEFLDAYLEHPVSGDGRASANQVSQILPNAISGSGESWGTLSGLAVGSANAEARTRFRFRLDACMNYTLDATVAPEDLAGSAPPSVRLSNALTDVPYASVEHDGHLLRDGRLSPGEYDLEGVSSVNNHFTASVTGGTYSMIFICTPCPTPLIAGQPADITTPNGGPASFTVTPSAPLAPGTAPSAPAATSYQWRKNMSPLSDGPNLTGVTTRTLSFAAATAADTGYYDVVLTSGAIEEPSRFAHLALGAGSDVAPRTPARGFALDAPWPNPFRRSVAFHFTTERPLAVKAAIYDAAGRLARSFGEQLVAGQGSFDWDGSDSHGAASPAGIYFFRAHAGGESVTRRFVRLP